MEVLIVVYKKSKKEVREIFLKLIDKVGMLDRKDFYLLKLFGG